jgi:hypothetical protein
MTDYIDNPTTPSRESALSDIAMGKKNPYDRRKKSKDWADKAARGIFANFSDRRGLKHELNSYDADVRRELVDTVAEIIRAAKDAG